MPRPVSKTKRRLAQTNAPQTTQFGKHSAWFPMTYDIRTQIGSSWKNALLIPTQFCKQQQQTTSNNKQNTHTHTDTHTHRHTHTHTQRLELQANPGGEFSRVISTPNRVKDSEEASKLQKCFGRSSIGSCFLAADLLRTKPSITWDLQPLHSHSDRRSLTRSAHACKM